MNPIVQFGIRGIDGARKFDIRTLLEFLVVLCTTLQGYYFYDYHVAPFPLLGFCVVLLLCLLTGAQVHLTDLLCVGMVLVLFAASSVVGALTVGNEYYWRNTVGTFAGPVYGLAFASYFRRRIDSLVACLSAVLFIHVAVATGQFFCFYVLGFYPDLLLPVTGEAQRYLGTGTITGLIRPTGLFPEPAHYAICVIILVFIINRFRRDLTLFQIFALLTSIFNFSLLGAAMTAAFLGCYWVSRSKKVLMKIVTLAVVAAVFRYGTGVVQNTSHRFENLQEDTSYNARYVGSFDYFNSLPLISKFVGTGTGITDSSSYGSVYSYFFIHFGFILTFALFSGGLWYLRVSCRTNLLALVYLGILFLGTLMPTYMTFWMTIAAVGILEQARHQSETAGARFPAKVFGTVNVILPVEG